MRPALARALRRAAARLQDGERWIGCRSRWDGAHLFDDAGRPIDGDDALRRQAALLAPDGIVLLARCAALVSDRHGLEALPLHREARAAGPPALCAWLDCIPRGLPRLPLPVQGGGAHARLALAAWHPDPFPRTSHPEVWLIERSGCLLLVVPGDALLPLAWRCAPAG
jgi:hypothetical protein